MGQKWPEDYRQGEFISARGRGGRGEVARRGYYISCHSDVKASKSESAARDDWLRAEREARSEVLSLIADKSEYERPDTTRHDPVTFLKSLYLCNHGSN